MIVTAIIGVLVSLALPAYTRYTNSSRFTEAVLAMRTHQDSFLVSAFSYRLDSLADADSGNNGIMDSQALTASTHGINITNGVITVTWKTDGTDLAGVDYTLTPSGVAPPLTWTAGGSCVTLRLC